MKTVETVKPNRGTFAGCCRFEAFSFGSILVIGTGTGALPVMDEVKKEAKRRHVQLLMLPTAKAIDELREDPEETNAILHVTC
jgi:hypothetical protein